MEIYKVNVLKNVMDTNMDDVRDILKVFDKIKSGSINKKIVEIRNSNDKAVINKLKESLPSFTVSATFSGKRRKEMVKDYNSLIHLDYDDIENPRELKNKFSKLETTFCAFISPSGNGLKVFIKTNATSDTHEKAFNELKSLYDNFVGIESDKSVKDFTRLCYASCDYSLYLNEESIVFDVIEFIKPKEITQEYTPEHAYNYTSNIITFTSGSRNVFTYTYACNANELGIEECKTIDYVASLSEPDFTYDEIERTVRNAYKRNSSQFAKLQFSKTATFDFESLQSPLIGDEIYNNLPQVLKEACSHFNNRERDVFLIASITVLSGYFSNVKGTHDKKLVYPNLYSFIIANAASGKSAAKYAKVFGKNYHHELRKSSQELMKEYKKAKSEYDKSKKSNKTENIEEPEKPNQLMFFVPGDTSEASLIGHIGENEGKGCVFETEADTISGANKQEWGGFSPVLRKNFHHEDISRTRKTDDEFTEISNSRFSFLTTGTPNQVNGLIPNSEDGLYSRFLFYVFSIPYEWRTTYTQEIGDSMDVILYKLGESFYTNQKNDKEKRFSLTPKQGNKLDDTFKSILKNMKNDDCQEEAVSVLYRHGLMTYKIAMTLSAIESNDDLITCSDKVFDLSINLITDVFLGNSLEQLKRMSNSNINSRSKQISFLKALPIDFERKEAVSVAKKIGIPQRSADNYLKILVQQGKIIKQTHGSYRKYN